MPIVIAAVALVGALCLLDLLLTFGVIRRLREHTAILTRPPRQEFGLTAGEVPAPFSAVTTEGTPVAGPAGLRVVAFFSRCSICPERVPPFAEYLTAQQISRDSVLAVSVGPGGPQPYLGELAQAAQICVEPEDGEIARAFKVAGFPAFFLLDDGVVADSEYDPVMLPQPATAMA